MNEKLLIAFAVISAVANFVGLIPYIRDIFARKTKPERATWWIWLALSTTAFSAQLASGASWSLLMTAAQATSVLVVALLSIKFGYGIFKHKDYYALLITFVGIGLWLLTNTPLIALLIVIALDIIALGLTITKTKEDPYSETLISWVLATLSGLFGLLAVGAFDFVELLYPLYITLGNGTLMVTIIRGRKKLL